MAYLKDLLKNLTYICIQGTMDRRVTHICHDSKEAVRGSMFICLKGSKADGHDYLSQAVRKGATVCVVSERVWTEDDVTVIRVQDTSEAMALIARNYYGAPAESMQMIGITGTKGKTTTACMLYQILKEAGIKCGLIGTLGIMTSDGQRKPGRNTTPDALVLQRELRAMADKGCHVCIMEVSSQGLKYKRTEGITFALGIYTNLSLDHIGPGEHRSFMEYASCKKRLFEKCRMVCANADDRYTSFMMEGLTVPVYTYGIEKSCDFRADQIAYQKDDMGFNLSYQIRGAIKDDIILKMPGTANVYNSLAAICAAHLLEIPQRLVKQALKTVKVKGRVEEVKISDKFDVVIDYAHNAISLETLLKTMRKYHPKRLVVLFGCGGNRSPLRRYQMGETAGRLADFTILTSDNPRYEKPEAIIADIEQGIRRTKGNYKIIADRRAAIAYAVSHAREGDLIIVAGKGHEEYQEIEGHFYPMSERKMIESSI